MTASDLLQTTISDLIQIKPEEFEKSSIQAIKDAIHAKYANKVSSPTWLSPRKPH